MLSEKTENKVMRIVLGSLALITAVAGIFNPYQLIFSLILFVGFSQFTK